MSLQAPVISAWSAVSPFGLGRQAFTAGLRAEVAPVATLDPDRYPAPVAQAYLVPADSAQELLGRKGTRTMDRATALAVSAVGWLLHEDLARPEVGVDENSAIVLGTSTGSISSIMSFIRDSLTQDKPYLVDAARFPNTVINCAASRSAIWHHLRGPNVTVAGGRASMLLALNHARRLLKSGRAPAALCGAVEEYSAERAWLAWHTRPDGQDHPMLLGEGAGVVLLERAETNQRRPLATLLAVEVGLAHSANDVGRVLATCLERAASEAGASWDDALWAVAPSEPPGEFGQRERETLERVLGSGDRRRLSCMAALGDTCSVSGAFQIGALLGEAQHDAASAGRLALTTMVDRDGTVGCVLLRLADGVQP
ncbi:beta-ketoacyl synthase N-terminal-like domain-containing protein [Caldimonas brevitalea]|uniref:3-oxoacyl-[acyl-carrier-protein] synthase II n=1 Tax=Caldimonas brevitalea TaxID=413882 RepID=A0A0G3BRS9_9BURK|nr:beta-ketoacyl synthase N-terminal-like domain-containing protein [Caldimonas brevitalea]AKJ30086.1 3-oxoacyl-[acyl-carrier-protein] synthase II [Caldimonas brevitalea]